MLKEWFSTATHTLNMPIGILISCIPVQHALHYTTYTLNMSIAGYVFPPSREVEGGVKTGGRNSNHLKFADDTILLAENSNDLKWFLMKVKEESAKAGLQLNSKTTKIITTELQNFNTDNEETEIVRYK